MFVLFGLLVYELLVNACSLQFLYCNIYIDLTYDIASYYYVFIITNFILFKFGFHGAKCVW